MPESAELLVSRLRDTFNSGVTRDLDWRRAQLAALSAMLRENEELILAALAADLGKPRFEAWAGDVASSATETMRPMAMISTSLPSRATRASAKGMV